MSSKRGLIVGQVFIYILVMVTFALVLIFGYRAISGFLQSSEDVAFVQFKTDLENSIKRIATEFGAVRIEEYTTPLAYENICFVNMDYENIAGELSALCAEDAYACDVWQDALEAQQGAVAAAGYEAVAENVFLQPQNTIPMKAFRFTIDDGGKGYLCEDIVQGKFRLRLEGQGDRTKLSRAPLRES